MRRERKESQQEKGRDLTQSGYPVEEMDEISLVLELLVSKYYSDDIRR